MKIKKIYFVRNLSVGDVLVWDKFVLDDVYEIILKIKENTITTLMPDGKIEKMKYSSAKPEFYVLY